MTRRYWAGVMVFSLILTGAAATFVYLTLQEKSTVVVPLRPPAAAQPVEPAPTVSVSTATAPPPSASLDTTGKSPETSAANSSADARNIMFSYHAAGAKDVF